METSNFLGIAVTAAINKIWNGIIISTLTKKKRKC